MFILKYWIGFNIGRFNEGILIVDIVKIVRYIMMCLLEMVKMVFDGLCEHFTYKYIPGVYMRGI